MLITKLNDNKRIYVKFFELTGKQTKLLRQPIIEQMIEDLYDIENILSKYGVKCFKMYKVKKSYIEELQGARLYIPIKIGKFNNELVFDGYFCEDPLNLSRVGGLLEIKTKKGTET